MRIARLSADNDAAVLAASALFDERPTAAWTAKFLANESHHLLFAYGDDDSAAIGFISGVETTHPDKGTEMYMSELAVDDGHRRRGVGKALVTALADLARSRGCNGMWCAVEPDNVAALATYRAASAEPEPCVTFSWQFDDASS